MPCFLTIGLISESESLFTYQPGTGFANFTNTSFIPVFSDGLNLTSLFGNDQELLQKAQAACGSDTACLYDASQTQDLNLAVQAKDNVNSFQTAEKEAGMIRYNHNIYAKYTNQ